MHFSRAQPCINTNYKPLDLFCRKPMPKSCKIHSSGSSQLAQHQIFGVAICICVGKADQHLFARTTCQIQLLCTLGVPLFTIQEEHHADNTNEHGKKTTNKISHLIMLDADERQQSSNSKRRRLIFSKGSSETNYEAKQEEQVNLEPPSHLLKWN